MSDVPTKAQARYLAHLAGIMGTYIYTPEWAATGTLRACDVRRWSEPDGPVMHVSRWTGRRITDEGRAALARYRERQQ